MTPSKANEHYDMYSGEVKGILDQIQQEGAQAMEQELIQVDAEKAAQTWDGSEGDFTELFQVGVWPEDEKAMETSLIQTGPEGEWED